MFSVILILFGKLIIINGIISLFIGVSDGLRDLRVSIPEAVSSGESAVLHCHYDLEHDQLYSFKWYKNKHEFFRYIPKELPHTKIFPIPGVDVDMHRSGPGTLVLRSVSSSISDRYRCEVIADAPTYRTLAKSGYMHIVDVPRSPPEITVEKSRLAPGETLVARCSSPASYPAPNVSWTFNGYRINASRTEQIAEKDFLENLKNLTQFEEKNQDYVPQFGKTYYDSFQGVTNQFGQTRSDQRSSQTKHETSIKITRKHEVENREKKITVSSLILRLEGEISRHNRLKLTCSATIFNLYNKKSEMSVDIERPHTASILVMATGLNTGDCVVHHAKIKLIITVLNVLIVRYVINKIMW